MIRTLIEHDDSLVLVIDQPILDLLNITRETPLEITTDGHSLIITPVRDTERQAKIATAVDDTLRKYPNTLRKLAE